MEKVRDRLKKYLNYKGLKDKEFCSSLGVSTAYISSMRESISPDKLKSIALLYDDLNITWLLTGEGEMLKEPVGDEAEAEPTLGELARMIADHDRRFHDQMERIMDAMGIEKNVKNGRTA